MLMPTNRTPVNQFINTPFYYMPSNPISTQIEKPKIDESIKNKTTKRILIGMGILGATIAAAILIYNLIKRGNAKKALNVGQDTGVKIATDTKNAANNIAPETATSTKKPAGTLAKPAEKAEEVFSGASLSEILPKNPGKGKPLKNLGSAKANVEHWQQAIENAPKDRGLNNYSPATLAPHTYPAEGIPQCFVITGAEGHDYRSFILTRDNMTRAKFGRKELLGYKFYQLNVDCRQGLYAATTKEGNKVVGISLGSNRLDKAGRQIVDYIDFVSPNQEFTPLQQDLIRIFLSEENRGLITSEMTETPISRYIIDYSRTDPHYVLTTPTPLEMNLDTLLSAIQSWAKKSSATGEQVREFIGNVAPDNPRLIF